MRRILQWIGLAALSGLIQQLAVRAADRGVENETTRDVVVGAVIVLTVIGFFVVAWQFARSSASPGGPGKSRTPKARTNPKRATGETVCREVLSISPNELLDVNFNSFRSLKLGEIALLRRLKVRGLIQGGDLTAAQASRPDCVQILLASGINDPQESVDRLEQRRLIMEFSGAYVLMPSDPVDEFSAVLTRDPALVTAYQQVRQAVDRTIRFDGKPLAQ